MTTIKYPGIIASMGVIAKSLLTVRLCREKEALNIRRSQQGLEKVQGDVKRKQYPCVKSHYIKDISAILVQNFSTAEHC